MQVRRSPCEVFIRYQLLLGQDPKAVLMKVLELHLDPLDVAYIEKVRAQLRPPDPFFPRRKGHAASQAFLRRQQVYRLFHRDEHVHQAFKILESARGKEFVESMLISGAGSDLIASALNGHVHLAASGVGVELFKFFFFNTDLVDRTELRALLEDRANAFGGSWKKAYYKDSRRTAAALPQSPVSAMLAQIRFGVIPSEVELEQLLKRAQFVSLGRAVEAALNGGPEDAGRTRDYMTAAKTAQDMLAGQATPSAQLLKNAHSIKLRMMSNTSIPLIGQITRGQHTENLLPRTAQDVDDDERDAVEQPASRGG